MPECVVQELEIPPEIVGELSDSSSCLDDSDELQQRLRNDGYLLLRQALDYEQVMAARREDAGGPGGGGRDSSSGHRGHLYRNQPERGATGGFGRLLEVGQRGPGDSAADPRRGVARDHGTGCWESPAELTTTSSSGWPFPDAPPASTTTIPFFARGSQRVHTVWLALGEVTIEQGPPGGGRGFQTGSPT